MLSLFAGAAFLTKMCYLSLAFNTVFVIVFLALFYFYVRARLEHSDSSRVFGTCLCGVAGRCAGKLFSHVRPAVWSNAVRRVPHMTVQVLVSPIIVGSSHAATGSTATKLTAFLPDDGVCLSALTRSSSCGTKSILAAANLGTLRHATDLSGTFAG